MNTMGDPKVVLNQWLAAVNALDLAGLSRLYHVDAVLVPTFSTQIRKTPERIQDYFQSLAECDRVVVLLDESTLTIQPIQGQAWCLSGHYTWDLVTCEESKYIKARFSYIIDLSSDQPILHHHSSELPQMP